jgi:hypothetical protein
MKRIILIVTIALLSCDNPKESLAVDLIKLERITKEEKLKLINELEPTFKYLATYDNWQQKVFDDFHFVDLDNDKDTDLVFTGWSGGEPVCVRIYNNINGRYQQAFEAYQEITKIEFADEKLSRVLIHDPGCCAAYIEFDEDYAFQVSKDDFKFKITNRTALLYPTEEPKDKFDIPINFEVLNDKYYLRLTPKIDTVDQVFAEDMQPDNVIAEFKKGTKGVAYAQREDDTGRVWWFVEIDAKDKPAKSFFYDIDDKPTKVKGWMSSNYLKKL